MKPQIKLIFLLLIVSISSLGAEVWDAELLYQQDEITVMPNKLSKKSVYRIKINNRAGERYTSVSIAHSKISQVSNIEAHIENAQGQVIRKLSRSDIDLHSAYSGVSFYSDEMISEFTLRHNTYPYILEYSFEVKETDFLSIDRWTPFLSWGIPTREARLIINMPLEYPLRYSTHILAAPDSIIDEKGKVYTWKASYFTKDKGEVWAPPFWDIVPWVKVASDQFDFDKKGSFRSWQTFGDWQLKLLEGLGNLPDDEKVRLRKLVEGIDDEKEKIRRLYHDMQDATRYISVSIETGGLKPYSAGYVSQNKYGDCKALANYFKTVLEVVGIQSNYTLIYGSAKKQVVDTNFPFPQFNHAILFVPLESDTLWLDCTSDGPFNYLGSFTQNRNAFVVENGNSHFVRTPALLPADVIGSRKINVWDEGQKGVNVRIDGKYKGDMFEQINLMEDYKNEKDRFRYVADYFLNDGFELDNYSLKKPDRDSTWIGLTMNATSSNLFRSYGNETLVCNIPYNIPELEKPEERQYPVQIDVPVLWRDTITYQLPIGANIAGVREDKKIQSPYGEYEIRCVLKDGSLQVFKECLIHSGKYPLQSYSDFFDFMKQIKAEENKPLLIVRK